MSPTSGIFASGLPSFYKAKPGAAGALIFILKKKIPMGSGLGGGSSDAATTLIALNRLWKLHLSKARLSALGARLGADVPIFVGGHSAWAEGIGEKIEPVDLPDCWFVVIYPGVIVPTGKLFGDPELTRDARPITIRDYFAGATVNAFEPIVRRQYPAVDAACEWLSNQAVNPSIKSRGTPRMTGTGSCVFAGYADEQSAQRVAQNSKAECPGDWKIIVARSCNESPLVQKLKTAVVQ